MDFVSNAYTLAAFLVVFSLLYFWIAARLSEANAKIFSMPLIRFLLLTFAVVFLFLAQLNLWVGTGNTLFLTNQAACENVVANATITGNLTVYEYADSCASRVIPSTNERMYVVLGYVFAIQLIFLVLFFLFWAISVVFKW